MKVSLIIPALNEEETIGDVLDDVPHDIINEVIVVDGHSTDRTPQIVKEKGAKLILQEGKGYGRGMTTGVKHATGDVLVFIDADGSYVTEDIPKLLKCLDEGYDLAFGSRYLPESGSDDDTPIRYLGNKIFTKMLNIIHKVPLSDSLFHYVCAKRKVFDTIEMKSTSFEYCMEFPIRVHKAGFKFKEIPSFERKRAKGESKVNALLHGLRILWVLLRG